MPPTSPWTFCQRFRHRPVAIGTRLSIALTFYGDCAPEQSGERLAAIAIAMRNVCELAGIDIEDVQVDAEDPEKTEAIWSILRRIEQEVLEDSSKNG